MEAIINILDLRSKEKEIIKEISKLNEMLKAIQLVLGLYHTNVQPNVTSISSADINSQGNVIKPLFEGREPETQEEKVYAILNILGTARAKDVAVKLIEFYPDSISEKRALDIATLQLSNLKRDGKIEGNKILGKNSFEYRINNEAHDNIY